MGCSHGGGYVFFFFKWVDLWRWWMGFTVVVGGGWVSGFWVMVIDGVWVWFVVVVVNNGWLILGWGLR